jgi:AcrR family transcriptional regulator
VTSPPAESTRERLLRAAADLCYAEGITATGVDRLCRAAGVSKRSMYQLFETKDALVAESLERFGPVVTAGYVPADAAAMSPRDAVLHVFERLDAAAGAPGFHGCPYVTAATELRDPQHPASVVARRHKARLAAFFAQQARRGGTADPELLGEQLTAVFDGVGARSVVRGGGVPGLGVSTASALLDAAGLVAA